MVQRGRADYLTLGDYNAVCYECGRKRKASMLKKHWQGYFVCPEHWEPRHPQDFVRGVMDVQTVPWAQDMSDTFTGPSCDLWGLSSIPGWAVPNCSTPSTLNASLTLGQPADVPGAIIP